MPSSGARDVWGGIHLLGDAVLVRTTGDRTKRSSPPGRASRPSAAGGVEKGGLAAALRADGIRADQRIVWAGEMRVGLYG